MSNTQTKIATALLAGGLALGGGSALALEKGDWIVRVGATGVYPDASSDEVPGLPGSEIDLEGDGSISGLGDIGETKHLPPTLTVNYHFMPGGNIRPYVGAGLNYTYFWDEETKGALNGLDLDLDDSWGLSAQVGVDVSITDTWFGNASVRYIDIDTEADLESFGEFDVDIDPWVYTVSIGRTF